MSDDQPDLARLIEQAASDTRVVQSLQELARAPELLQQELRRALEAFPLPSGRTRDAPIRIARQGSDECTQRP
jgi:hypothetical protein